MYSGSLSICRNLTITAIFRNIQDLKALMRQMKYICTWIVFHADLNFYFVDHCSYVKDKNFSNGVDRDKLEASELFAGSFNPSLSQEFLYCLFVHYF